MIIEGQRYYHMPEPSLDAASSFKNNRDRVNGNFRGKLHDVPSTITADRAEQEQLAVGQPSSQPPQEPRDNKDREELAELWRSLGVDPLSIKKNLEHADRAGKTIILPPDIKFTK